MIPNAKSKGESSAPLPSSFGRPHCFWAQKGPGQDAGGESLPCTPGLCPAWWNPSRLPCSTTESCLCHLSRLVTSCSSFHLGPRETWILLSLWVTKAAVKAYQTPWVRLMASVWDSWRLDLRRVTPKPHSGQETNPGYRTSFVWFQDPFFVCLFPSTHSCSA